MHDHVLVLESSHPRLGATALAACALIAVLIAGCGAGARAAKPPPSGPFAPEVVPAARAGASFRIPDPATVSYDAGSRHVEEVVRGGSLRVHTAVRALIISSVTDRGALLLHRLAELHARLRVGQFPEGASVGDRLYISSRGWTSGFWPGALWQAAALVPGAGGRMFASWALRATIAHLGLERSNTHDVGFMYVQSSLAGWRALCSGPGRRRAGRVVCARLRRSVVAAADELLKLARSNPGAGTIPTNATRPYADTIVDSMMNIQLLPWAYRFTRDHAFPARSSSGTRGRWPACWFDPTARPRSQCTSIAAPGRCC